MAAVRTSNCPAIKNAPLVGLAEGNGSFSNLTLAALVLGVPYILKRWLPIVSYGGTKTYWFLVLLFGLPIAIGYWTFIKRRILESLVSVTTLGGSSAT